jgi:hypothetical protein
MDPVISDRKSCDRKKEKDEEHNGKWRDKKQRIVNSYSSILIPE